MASLNDYLFVSGLLFAIGLAGVIVRKNIIVIFMCLELMLASASLTLVAFSRFHLLNGLPDYNGQVFVFFIITVAAAEVAVSTAATAPAKPLTSRNSPQCAANPTNFEFSWNHFPGLSSVSRF